MISLSSKALGVSLTESAALSACRTFQIAHLVRMLVKLMLSPKMLRRADLVTLNLMRIIIDFSLRKVKPTSCFFRGGKPATMPA